MLCTYIYDVGAMSQWKIQWEAKNGPGSDSKMTEMSTGESTHILSSNTSGGTVVFSSFSGVWCTTSHPLANDAAWS